MLQASFPQKNICKVDDEILSVSDEPKKSMPS